MFPSLKVETDPPPKFLRAQVSGGGGVTVGGERWESEGRRRSLPN